MALKIVVNEPKSRKSKQIEVEESHAKSLFGRKIGATLKGTELGLADGYELKVTGGSDNAGFPMRAEIPQPGRRKIFAVGGVGIKPSRRGMRVRKTVHGGVISEQTAQLNAIIVKEGSPSLFEEPKTEEAPAEAEAPKEE